MSKNYVMKMIFKVLFLSFTLALVVQMAHAQNNIQVGCNVYSKNGTLIKKYAGQFCLFFNDGSFISTFDDHVTMFGKDLSVLWTQNMRAHHQLNYSIDKKNMLVIGSENIAIKNKDKVEKVRSDVLFILNRSGKIVKKFSLYENRRQFNKIPWQNAVHRRFKIFMNADKIRFHDSDWELTHTNSFYEVSQSFRIQNPKLKNAYYVVNDISLMLVFFLDKDLKNIVWQGHLSNEKWTMFHDVQALESGNLLIYDNGTRDFPKTKITEFNLKKNKVIFSHSVSSKRSNYSPYWGGVQKLTEGGYLFTDISDGPRIIQINSSGKTVVNFKLPAHVYLQQAKEINLKSFFKNNQGI